MKILEVSGSGGVGVGHMGPVTTVTTCLANSFAKLGCDVTVADARTDQDRTALNLNGVNLIEVDSPQWPNNSKSQSIEKFVSGLSQIDIEKYDVVHVHDYRVGKLIEDSYNIGCVFTVHTPLWANPELPLKKKLKYFLQRAIGKHEYNYIQSCKLTIALGSFLQRVVNGGNIKIIQNGVDLSRWKQEEQARLKLGIKDQDFVLLLVGRAHEIKGHHLLIEATKQLNIKNLKVIFVGKLSDDEYSRKLLLLAEGLPVTFAGFISNRTPEFLQYLSAADVLIVPSVFDNQPGTLMEGLAMNLPVIGSTAGGIPDMLDAKVGLLFENGSVDELAQCIRTLYEDSDLRRKMAEHGRQYVQNNFTWDASAKKHLVEFKKLLA